LSQGGVIPQVARTAKTCIEMPGLLCLYTARIRQASLTAAPLPEISQNEE
jgi:hypothetical protein